MIDVDASDEDSQKDPQGAPAISPEVREVLHMLRSIEQRNGSVTRGAGKPASTKS